MTSVALYLVIDILDEHIAVGLSVRSTGPLTSLTRTSWKRCHCRSLWPMM